MNVLFLPKHEYMGASSRYRTLYYLPYLKNNNINFNLSPLFNDEYLAYKYLHKKENKTISIKRIIKRILTILFFSKHFDLLVIEKELLPYFPPFLEWYLNIRKIKYIVDYDDAIWHNYDQHRFLFVRILLKNKIKYVMMNSEIVLAGSEYILRYSKNLGVKNYIKIPTVINIDKYTVTNKSSDKKFIIGWIGSSTSSQYILKISDVLEKFTEKNNAIVHLIGFDEKLCNKLSFSHRVIEWTEDTEVSEIFKFDVGIMPLADLKFERGKCGFKLIQYMGCKKPVIASPVGENNLIIENKVNGLFATNNQEWLESLTFFYNNKKSARQYGENGFKKVKENYSLDSNKDKYIEALKNTYYENITNK